MDALDNVRNCKMLVMMILMALALKLIYSEKATQFCEIFLLLLTVCTAVKSKGKILQNFVAFSEYVNFKIWKCFWQKKTKNKVKSMIAIRIYANLSGRQKLPVYVHLNKRASSRITL